MSVAKDFLSQLCVQGGDGEEGWDSGREDERGTIDV
jgi:hypothetical protein